MEILRNIESAIYSHNQPEAICIGTLRDQEALVALIVEEQKSVIHIDLAHKGTLLTVKVTELSKEELLHYRFHTEVSQNTPDVDLDGNWVIYELGGGEEMLGLAINLPKPLDHPQEWEKQYNEAIQRIIHQLTCKPLARVKMSGEMIKSQDLIAKNGQQALDTHTTGMTTEEAMQNMITKMKKKYNQ